jgi:hypothetical protein
MGEFVFWGVDLSWIARLYVRQRSLFDGADRDSHIQDALPGIADNCCPLPGNEAIDERYWTF